MFKIPAKGRSALAVKHGPTTRLTASKASARWARSGPILTTQLSARPTPLAPSTSWEVRTRTKRSTSDWLSIRVRTTFFNCWLANGESNCLNLQSPFTAAMPILNSIHDWSAYFTKEFFEQQKLLVPYTCLDKFQSVSFHHLIPYCDRCLDLDEWNKHGRNATCWRRANIGEVSSFARWAGCQHRYRPVGCGGEPGGFDRVQQRRRLSIDRPSPVKVRCPQQQTRLLSLGR